MSCRDTAAAASTVDIPTGWDPRTKQQPTGLIAYPACGRAVLFESLQVSKPAFDLCAHRLMCTQKKSSSVKITLLLKVDLEGFEPLTSRMRTERSPMRTLKKPPKDKTFLWENGKKYRRNAVFWTSIAFEKKLPFLLQCKKVTLQERCASDVI